METMMNRFCKTLTVFLCLIMLTLSAYADELTPLPMDTCQGGPAPADENYLSPDEYLDESLHVRVFEGRYADTDYVYAYVKISDPSQLRTVPASMVLSPSNTFLNTDTQRGRYIARAVNAIIAINGDYYTKNDKCQIVMRQTQQIRNTGNGLMDVLIIDKNGDFDYIQNATRQAYTAYFEANADNMYQVFCLGPVLIENGEIIVNDETYANVNIGPQKKVQRSAIAQIGPLEYLLL